MTTEFLASKLSDCSSLVYIDNSYVFYSSSYGDSYVLKIWADHQGNRDQPYISIEQTFKSLAPIIDVKLRNPEAKRGQQNELVIISGLNHKTHMNIVKQGISLRSLFSFESVLSAGLVSQFFTLGDIIVFKIFNFDQLLALKAAPAAALLSA